MRTIIKWGNFIRVYLRSSAAERDLSIRVPREKIE
jgi:hypothetical protein